MRILSRFASIISRLKIAFSDPNAAIKYIVGGREGVVRFKLSQLLQTKDSGLKKYFHEFDEFDEYIKSELLSSGMKYFPPIDFGKTLYVICRVMRPMTIVETGVAAGLSTSYMLHALEKNGRGELHSIDIPNYEAELIKKIPSYLPEPLSILPPKKNVGFLVPENLKHRWHLHLGLSKDLLPNLCKSLGEIDIFLHDSEHTYENMWFEYTTAWRHLRNGGYLLSDDTWWNTAFKDFCHKVKAKPVYIYSTGLAGIRKADEVTI